MLEDNERIFLVKLKDNNYNECYAQFRFRPYDMMEIFLNDYNINYKESKELISGVYQINSEDIPLTMYKIKCKNCKNKYYGDYHQFMFLSDIIEKILDYYNIEYEKELI